MALALEMRVEGAEAVGSLFARVAQTFGDLTDLWDVIEPWWYGLVDDSFGSEESHLLGAWPELGALADGGPPGAYGRWKKKHHPGLPLLELDGTLRDALTGQGEGYAEKTSKSMTIGSTLPYWRTHQRGRPEQHIPQRQFAAIGPEQQGEFDRAVQEVLNEWNREWNEEQGGGMAR